MMRKRWIKGAWVGGLTGLLLTALLYLVNEALNAPFVPYDLWNWQARVVPGNILSLAVAGIGTGLAGLLGGRASAWGKTSEQIGALIIFVIILAAFGSLAAWIKRRRGRSRAGLWSGVLLWITVGAVELTLGMRSPLLSLLWLGLAILGWGVTVDAVLDGDLFRSLSSETNAERRQSLIQLAGSAIGASLAAWGFGYLISATDEGTGADRPLTDLATPSPSPSGANEGDLTPTPVAQATQPAEGATTAEIPVGDDGRIVPVPGTREEITPRGEFYRVDINASPLSLDGNLWRLVMAGLLEQTPRLTIRELRAYPIHTQPITLSCISNPIGGTAISTAYWTGLRLSDLLEDLGLLPEAEYLYIQSADGFYETVPMDDMMAPKTLLVYGMNDRSLPEKHGFPLRIYIPNRYGMKQPKWIERIEATDTDQGGYWTDRGWSKQAIPNTTSVIDVVGTDIVQNGSVPIGGVAWAGARGIRKVEVQIDNGEWQPATLREPALSPLAWVQWRYEWQASPGAHTVTARATDGEGNLQTAEKSGTLPNGATGYHSVETEI